MSNCKTFDFEDIKVISAFETVVIDPAGTSIHLQFQRSKDISMFMLLAIANDKLQVFTQCFSLQHTFSLKITN
jgi:hypothetical protein